MSVRMRVKENERLVRDGSTFAILNTDKTALEAHNRKMEQLRKAKAHEEEINTLKRDITEIKDLLAQLLQQRK